MQVSSVPRVTFQLFQLQYTTYKDNYYVLKTSALLPSIIQPLHEYVRPHQASSRNEPPPPSAFPACPHLPALLRGVRHRLRCLLWSASSGCWGVGSAGSMLRWGVMSSRGWGSFAGRHGQGGGRRYRCESTKGRDKHILILLQMYKSTLAEQSSLQIYTFYARGNRLGCQRDAMSMKRSNSSQSCSFMYTNASWLVFLTSWSKWCEYPHCTISQSIQFECIIIGLRHLPGSNYQHRISCTNYNLFGPKGASSSHISPDYYYRPNTLSFKARDERPIYATTMSFRGVSFVVHPLGEQWFASN